MTDFDPHKFQFLTENINFQNQLQIFRAENTTKSNAFMEQKTNSLTLPVQLQNNGRKISTSEVIYGILELKLHP